MPQISLSPRSASRSLLARRHTQASSCQFAADRKSTDTHTFRATRATFKCAPAPHLRGRKRTATLMLWQLALLASEPRSWLASSPPMLSPAPARERSMAPASGSPQALQGAELALTQNERSSEVHCGHLLRSCSSRPYKHALPLVTGSSGDTRQRAAGLQSSARDPKSSLSSAASPA